MSHTHFVNVRDELPLRRVPRLLLGSPQLGLDVEQLYLQISSLCVPEEGRRGRGRGRGRGELRGGRQWESGLLNSLNRTDRWI